MLNSALAELGVFDWSNEKIYAGHTFPDDDCFADDELEREAGDRETATAGIMDAYIVPKSPREKDGSAEPMWAELAVSTQDVEERRRYLALSALYDKPATCDEAGRLRTAIDTLSEWDIAGQLL